MIDSTDGRLLNQQTQNPSAMSDGAKAKIGIQTRTPGLTTYNTGSDAPATHRNSTTSVQLQSPTGRVAILGTTVEPEVYERMKETSPEAFLPEAEKLAEAAAAEADAAAAEAERASMNTHPDAFIEESHTQFTNVVPAQLQTELLVQMNRDGVPSTGTLNRVAESLGVSVDEAVTRLNAMSAGVQAQLSVLAKARGVNPERFANWARDNHRGESLRAMQGHVQGRQLLSWDTLIAEFKARGQHDPLR
jgi:hypothetical protein